MTFKEFFDNLDLIKEAPELSTVLDSFSAVLDLPKASFNAVKDDYAASLLQQFAPENLMRILGTSQGSEINPDDVIETFTSLFELLSIEVNENIQLLDAEKVDYFQDLLSDLGAKFYALPQRKTVAVGIELVDDRAVKPTYAHPYDAGADVYAIEDTTIKPNETVLISTGFKVKVPEGYELQARPRSGMSLKTKIRLSNAPGTIDCGYSGVVGVILDNIGAEEYTIKQGDRVCQLLIKPCPKISWYDTKVEDDRVGGFGSTGK